jgi:hypothetical protein
VRSHAGLFVRIFVQSSAVQLISLPAESLFALVNTVIVNVTGRKQLKSLIFQILNSIKKRLVDAKKVVMKILRYRKSVTDFTQIQIRVKARPKMTN